jgi:hypothetical protein
MFVPGAVELTEKLLAEQPMPHCTENPIYVFPEMKLRFLVPNSYIPVSVSDLYIPRSAYLAAAKLADPS